MKVFEEGNREREFGHCLVAGIATNPRKVNRTMSKKQIISRSKVKPFVKYINFRHLMPTRYSADIDLKTVVTAEAVGKVESKADVTKEVKRLFETRYLDRGQNKSGVQFFFDKLKF